MTGSTNSIHKAGIALNKEICGDALTGRLIALAEQQTASDMLSDQSDAKLQFDGNSEASSFLCLFDSSVVNHRLPLLEASTLEHYRAMLKSRWSLLSEWLEAASQLPALKVDGTRQSDNSLCADRVPGGTLHHHFDSACKAVSCLLEGSPIVLQPHEKSAMTAFSNVCHERLELPADRVKVQLIGAIVMGLLADIASLLKHPGELRPERGVTRKKLRAGLSDLLDTLDVLSLQSKEHTLQFSEDYLANKREHRARRLLEAAHKNNRDCVDTQLALARLYARLGKSLQSVQHLQAVILVHPDDLPLRKELALLLLESLEFSEAINHWKHALTLAEPHERPQIRGDLELTEALHDCEISAASNDCVPTITLTEEERISGRCHPTKLALAVKFYQLYGTLVIHNVYSTELIEKCRAEFLHRYRRYFANRKHQTALQIGDRRFQISLALAGAFNDPEFYANPFIVQLMKRLLGNKLIIGSTVCATSLPGSRDQHGHKDHRALFTETADDDPMILPPVAVTTMIPLVSVDEENGTTLVKKGSHLLSRRASYRLDYQVPIVPAGSCYLMDSALTHKGQGNRTDQVRPIVNMVYQRSWFVDNKNFRNQPPLQIDSVEYRQIPKEYRYLFDWAIQPGASVNTPR